MSFVRGALVPAHGEAPLPDVQAVGQEMIAIVTIIKLEKGKYNGK